MNVDNTLWPQQLNSPMMNTVNATQRMLKPGQLLCRHYRRYTHSKQLLSSLRLEKFQLPTQRNNVNDGGT